MPVFLKDILKIEENFNLDINIFGDDGGNIFPLDHIKDSGKETVSLLFTSDKKTGHYVWIKNFNKLCSKVTKHTDNNIFV